MRLVFSNHFSFNGSPLISSTRLQRLQRDVASLREHEALCSRQARTQQDVDWINQVLRDGILAGELAGNTATLPSPKS